MRKVEFTCIVFKEGETFVSACPELSVASCGDTVDEARVRLKEAVRLFLEEAARMGTLEDILREDGFVAKDPAGKSWGSPPLIVTEHSEVTF